MSTIVLNSTTAPRRTRRKYGRKILDALDVAELKGLYIKGYDTLYLSQKFGVCESHVNHIGNGRRWPTVRPATIHANGTATVTVTLDKLQNLIGA